MKGRRAEEQIIRILQQAESGIPVADVLRENNISQGTSYEVPGLPVCSLTSTTRISPARWVQRTSKS